MAGKILILRWTESAYDSLGGLLELFAQEFAALGFEVILFPTDDALWPERLIERLQAGDITFAITMSGIAADLANHGTLIWETADVPLFNWNCDHPCYFPSRHVIRNRFLIQAYVFPDHADYAIAHLKPPGPAVAVHLGIPPRSLFPHAPLPLQGRNGRIMFTKSGHDTNTIEATWRTFAPDAQAIVFAAAEALFHSPTAAFLPALQQIAAERGILLHGTQRSALLMIQEIDKYIRFRRANLIMKTVLRFPVDVFGSGWDHIDWSGARARFHGPVSWRATISLLPHYVGCLSTNPLVEDSVHDRTFFALSAGVVPVADSNRFSRTHMPALEPYTFSFSREPIEQAVEALLDSPPEALARTEATWQALAAPFGTRRAAEQIVRLARQEPDRPA